MQRRAHQKEKRTFRAQETRRLPEEEGQRWYDQEVLVRLRRNYKADHQKRWEQPPLEQAENNQRDKVKEGRIVELIEEH